MTAIACLHIHREPTPPTCPETVAANIAEAVAPVFDAFELHSTLERQQDHLVCRIHATGEEPDSASTIQFPVTAFMGISATVAPHLGLDDTQRVIRHSAAVEAALACRTAGLVRNYCDPYHWDRIVTDATPQVVAQALERLNLPSANPTPSKPQPDPLAVSAAQRLTNHLGAGYHVILFGSRHRGDHVRYSDIDLLIQLSEDTEEHFNRAYAALGDMAENRLPLVDGDDPPHYDALIIDHWGKAVWNHPRERLNPDGGTVTAFALPGTRLPHTDEMPLWFPDGELPSPDGATAYLLTDSATVAGSHGYMGWLEYLDRPSCKR